ncbi:MAG TPA: hypothetical protein DCY89_08980 [Gammaproteobacteria bacterium]|nr:hypothetical protein [Gammaproteobacteria bacterium]
MKHTYFLGLASLALAGNCAATEKVVVSQAISVHEALAAQEAWCKALIEIGSTYEESGHEAAKALAEKVLDTSYGFQLGVVLFKPTLTVSPQTFRTARAEALSYFVGGDPAFPDDAGFALKGWRKCEVENAAVFITGDSATTMGKVHLTDKEGSVTSVDKTWKFVKDDAGKLRIVVHHSSLEHSED